MQYLVQQIGWKYFPIYRQDERIKRRHCDGSCTNTILARWAALAHPVIKRDLHTSIYKSVQMSDDKDHEIVGFSLYAISRSEEHTSELQSLMSISYAVFCLKKKIKN